MFYTEKELSECLKVSTIFLYQCRKKGMPFIRLGRSRIRYDLDSVLEWFKNNDDFKKNGGFIE